MFLVQYTHRALKSLNKIPIAWRKRILKAIDGLKSEPFQGKKLRGELEGSFSLRVWPYRIIYLVNKKQITIIIMDIGHRQNVYK